MDEKDVDFHESDIYQDVDKDKDFNRRVIKLVKEYPILFDRTHKHFFHRKFNDAAWNAIGAKLNRMGTKCEKAYKALYMKFGIHHVMVNDPEYRAKGWPKEDFPYYQDMMFLKDHFHLIRAQKRAKMMLKYEKRKADALLGIDYREVRKAEAAARRNERNRKNNEARKAKWESKLTQEEKDAYARKLERKKKFAEAAKRERERAKMEKYHEVPPQPIQPSLPTVFPTPGPSSMPILPTQSISQCQEDFSEDFTLDNFDENWPETEPEAPKPEVPEKPKGPPLKANDVEFFFKSVAQQVVRARLSADNFSDLKSTILTALNGKLPNINKKIRFG